MMNVSGGNKRRDHTKKETMKCRKEIRLTYGELEELQRQDQPSQRLSGNPAGTAAFEQ